MKLKVEAGGGILEEWDHVELVQQIHDDEKHHQDARSSQYHLSKVLKPKEAILYIV